MTAPVTLVVGPEELLAERAVAGLVAAARKDDPDVLVHEVEAGEVAAGRLAELVSPSLFGGTIVVVLHAAQDLSGDALKELTRYLEAPADDVAVILVHKGGAKGKALHDAAQRAGAASIACPEMKRYADKIAFVRAEARSASRSLSDGGARTLLDAVGNDSRELAAAVSQLVADTTGPIDESVVRRYYSGRAEATSFTVADCAVEGRTADALEQLRWALSVGVAPVLVTSALAQGVRNIIKVGSAQRRARPADLARELSMPSWKVDRVRSQLRGWTPDGLQHALHVVADADAAVKGAEVDPAYALERAVVRVAQARSR
jgi:DNA polymerase III subunit delta